MSRHKTRPNALHTCKPASVKRVHGCHRRRYRGTLDVHVTLREQKKASRRATNSSPARRRVFHLLEPSSCRRKCELLLRVCCTRQSRRLGSRWPSLDRSLCKQVATFENRPDCRYHFILNRKREHPYACGLNRLDS